MLFESMLGAEQDVLLFRRPGEAPFVDVNPGNVAVPALQAGNVDHLPTLSDIRQTMLPDGVPVHWAIATVKAREDGSEVEVIAAHPMTQEVRMLAAYRNRIVLATLTGMLAATLLAYYVLRRALRPIFETRVRRRVYPIVRGDSEMTVSTPATAAATTPVMRTAAGAVINLR